MYDCMVELSDSKSACSQSKKVQTKELKKREAAETKQQRQKEEAEIKHQRLIRKKNFFRICLRVVFVSFLSANLAAASS